MRPCWNACRGFRIQRYHRIERLVNPVVHTVFTSLLRFNAVVDKRHSSVASWFETVVHNESSCTSQIRRILTLLIILNVFANFRDRTV